MSEEEQLQLSKVPLRTEEDEYLNKLLSLLFDKAERELEEES